MDASALHAEKTESLAREQQARDAVAGAEAQLAMRRSDLAAAVALMAQRQSELDAARRRLARSTVLAQAGAAAVRAGAGEIRHGHGTMNGAG
jgi:HlyD family secretion protein